MWCYLPELLDIGRIEGSYLSEECAVDGRPDADRMKPLLFNMEARTYHSYGSVVADAYSAGRALK